MRIAWTTIAAAAIRLTNGVAGEANLSRLPRKLILAGFVME